MRWLIRLAPIAALALWPALASGQTARETGRGVGIVTTLTGTATVARAALPSPRPLRFKDDVFARDRIATAERSIVRVLLGGKALVTVRELSSLTIAEKAGRSAIDLRSGKIAMGVVHARMRPGEAIEIRTPNAIAAIRGTVLVVELIPAPAGAAGAPRYTTRVHVLHGLVEVSDPRRPGAPPALVGTRQSWSRTGQEPATLVPLSTAAAERIFADLHSAPQIVEGPPGFISAMMTREQATAAAVARLLAPDAMGAGGGGDGSADPAGPPSAARPGAGDAPVVVPSLSRLPAPDPPRYSYRGETVTVAGNFYALSGADTDTPHSPILEAANSALSVGQNLIDVSGGATLTSAGSGPLLSLDPSTLSASSLLALSGGARVSLAGSLFQDQSGGLDLRSDLLRLGGSAELVGSGSSALVSLAGSSAATAGGLLTASGTAVMDLLSASAPLLSLTAGAALTTERALADLTNSAQVSLGQLTSLTASSLAVRGDALALAGAAKMTVAGDLFRIAGGSTLTITGGALLNLSGASTLTLGGALINFVGTGNTLSISNALCGGACTLLGGLPVLVTGAGSITITDPVKNLGGNTVNITPGSAAIVVGGTAQLKPTP
jgi:FecR protein